MKWNVMENEWHYLKVMGISWIQVTGNISNVTFHDHKHGSCDIVKEREREREMLKRYVC